MRAGLAWWGCLAAYFGLCRAVAHSDCCFPAPCTNILTYFLLTYLLKLRRDVEGCVHCSDISLEQLTSSGMCEEAVQSQLNTLPVPLACLHQSHTYLTTCRHLVLL